jgi:hypothetical protein
VGRIFIAEMWCVLSEQDGHSGSGGGGVGCGRCTATARSYIFARWMLPQCRHARCTRRHSFVHNLLNLRSVSSQAMSGNGRFHNLGHFTNLNQILLLFSVETLCLKYSFRQLAVSIAAVLSAERSWVLFPAGARDLFFRILRPVVGPPTADQ